MVRRQNRNARVPRHASREPMCHALRHPRQFREGDTLYRLLPLNLKGNVVGELPGRFLKPLVEGGHGSSERNDTGKDERSQSSEVRSVGVWLGRTHRTAGAATAAPTGGGKPRLSQRYRRRVKLPISGYVGDTDAGVLASNANVSRADAQVYTPEVVGLGLKYNASVVVEVRSRELLQVPIPIPIVVIVGASHSKLIKPSKGSTCLFHTRPSPRPFLPYHLMSATVTTCGNRGFQSIVVHTGIVYTTFVLKNVTL